MDKTIITRVSTQNEKHIGEKYARTFLQRQFKANKLSRITKGKYSKSKDIYKIATNLFTPSYLSFWSASYFKGYTEQIVNEIQVAVTKKHKKINFEEYNINFSKLNKKCFFGFEKIKYGNGFIFVVDDEKLIIDSINIEKKIGNFDEILKIIKNAQIDREKIIKYLKRINNKSLNKKIGYLLEEYRAIDLSKEINYNDSNYVNLSTFFECTQINKKWKVKI